MATIKICVLASLLSSGECCGFSHIVAVCDFALSLMFVSTERIVGFVFSSEKDEKTKQHSQCAVSGEMAKVKWPKMKCQKSKFAQLE